jgi:hypothetical protein
MSYKPDITRLINLLLVLAWVGIMAFVFAAYTGAIWIFENVRFL